MKWRAGNLGLAVASLLLRRMQEVKTLHFVLQRHQNVVS